MVGSNGALTGVAPLARIRPIKFIDDDQIDVDRRGATVPVLCVSLDEDSVDAMNYALNFEGPCISLSVGGSPTSG